MTEITEKMLAELRERVKPYLTDKRYLHTLAVEEEAAALGSVYLPSDINRLRAAALLHDITKKLTADEQLRICEEFHIPATAADAVFSPKLFHAKTAAAIAARDFSDFADAQVVSGVRWHTTGRAGMTDFEAIIYLADYIEKTRTFEDCVKLREYFYGALAAAQDDEAKRELLWRTMALSFDMTIKSLMSDSSLIDRDTVEARNYYLMKLGTAARREK